MYVHIGVYKSIHLQFYILECYNFVTLILEETVAEFIFGGSKFTADADCSHEIKRCLLLERKVKTNLDSIFKSRDITLPTQGHLVKAMFFSSGHVWM